MMSQKTTVAVQFRTNRKQLKMVGSFTFTLFLLIVGDFASSASVQEVHEKFSALDYNVGYEMTIENQSNQILQYLNNSSGMS